MAVVCEQIPFLRRRLEGQTDESIVSVVAWRCLQFTSACTTTCEEFEVLHASVDEGFFLCSGPAFQSSFHFERLDTGLEFLVPYQ